MEKQAKFFNKEIFADYSKARNHAERFEQDILKAGNLQPGYLIIDVNLRRIVMSKGKNDVCLIQAYKDEYITEENQEDGATSRNSYVESSLIHPTEALIGYKELEYSEELFFKR